MPSFILAYLSITARFAAFILISASWGYSAPRNAPIMPQGSFTVMDERASDEISEISRLYLNGQLATTFRLDLNHPTQQASIPLPAGRMHIPYTLCGMITVIHDGHIETRLISGEGTLHYPQGHIYEAANGEDFKSFFLIDENAPDASEPQKGHSSLCSNVAS